MQRQRVLDANELRFSKQQLQQLREMYCRLRRLNRAVLVHLLKIHRSTDKQYSRAGKLLALHASRMNSLLRFWQEIVEAASSEDLESVSVNLPYICENCTENTTRLLSESRTASLRESFKPDSDWRSEIDWVLHVMRRAEEHVSQRCLLQRIPAGTFFSATSRLTKTFLQQKLRALEMTPKPMKLVQPAPDETCAGCGKPA